MKKEVFLNLTRIVEANAKIYISIIVGIAGCLMLYVAEAVHVQHIAQLLNTKDQQILRDAIEPVSQTYTWARSLTLIVGGLWSTYEYMTTKKKLGLKG